MSQEDALEASGPGGWGVRARGSHTVIVTAILVAGCSVGGGIYLGVTHGYKPLGAIEERIPQSKQEHADITAEVRSLRRSSQRRECIELLDQSERKNLRSNFTPYYLRSLCPWLAEDAQ